MGLGATGCWCKDFCEAGPRWGWARGSTEKGLQGGAEVGAADVVCRAEFVAGALEDDAAGFHYVGAMGDFEGVVGVLGGEENCDAFGGDLLNQAENLIEEDEREAQRRLVQEQQLRFGHEAAADCAHLLLAA